MNESAAAKALRLDEEPETSPRGALAIDHQAEGATQVGQGSASTVGTQDVRSIVEQRFNRMYEAHDRIRSEELALRLASTEIKPAGL